MTYMMISADDHIDLGYLPQRLMDRAVARDIARPRAARRRPRREGRVLGVRRRDLGGLSRRALVCRQNRTRLALDRGGVGEAHRPTTTAKRIDRHGSRRRRGVADVSADHRHAGGRAGTAQRLRARVQRLGAGVWQDSAEALFPRRHALHLSTPRPREMKSSASPSWVLKKPTS